MMLLVLASVPSTAGAAGELFFGQHHSYHVTFRGNGEAIVFARLVVQNAQNTPMTGYTFEVPGVIPSEMTMYQQILPRPCLQWEPLVQGSVQRPMCLKYNEPDYQSSTYSNYYQRGHADQNVEYKKIIYSETENVYTITFPEHLNPNQTSAIVLAYTAHGYVKKNLGLYTFSFETIKVPSRVQDVKVAVDVDSELYLKGKKAEVQYNIDYTSTASLGAATSVGLSSKEMDRTVQSIGTAGAITKNAKNLAPNEGFLVTGTYAKSPWRLNLFAIIATIVVFLIVAALITFVTIVIKRKRRNRRNTDEDVVGHVNQESSRHPSVFGWRSLVAGIISAGCIVAITFFMMFLANTRVVQRLDEVIAISAFIGVLLLYVLVIFGPALWLGSNHGRKIALATLVYELAGFLLFLLLYVLFVAITS